MLLVLLTARKSLVSFLFDLERVDTFILFLNHSDILLSNKTGFLVCSFLSFCFHQELSII